MNRLLFKFALAAAVAVGAGAAMAQEMGAAPVAPAQAGEATKPKAAVAEPALVTTAAPATTAAVVNPMSVSVDRGPEVVVANQKAAASVKPSLGGDAISAVQKALFARGFAQGFDPRNGSIIQVGVADVDMPDIKDPSFTLVRELLVCQAELDAKLKISGVVRRCMNGGVDVKRLDNNEKKAFEEKFASQIEALNQQRAKVKELLQQLDSAEAARLRQATAADQWKQLITAAIKKLDAKYSQSDIAAEKQQQYLKVKAAYEEALLQSEALESQRDMMFPKKSIEAYVDSDVPDMRLCGTVDLVQSESWDGKVFQVAVAVVWSPKLQSRAVTTLGRGKPVGGANGTLSLSAWLEQQSVVQDSEQGAPISKMVGTRQYIDDKGRQYVLGFSAVNIPDDATDREDARDRANVMAMQQVALYLYSEGKGSTKVKEGMAKYKGRGPELYAEVTGDLKETMPKNFTVSGLGIAYSTKCYNVLSGQHIHVAVAAVDSELAGKSSDILKQWYQGAEAAVGASQFMAGEQRGMEQHYQQTVNSPDAFNNGVNKGYNGLQPKPPVVVPSGNGGSVGGKVPQVPANPPPGGKPGVYITPINPGNADF